MKQAEEHINRIHQKLQELVKRHQALQKKCAQQQNAIAELSRTQEENEKKVKLLEEQQLILKSASGGLNVADKKAFEQTLNRYIREIDKCIAILSE